MEQYPTVSSPQDTMQKWTIPSVLESFLFNTNFYYSINIKLYSLISACIVCIKHVKFLTIQWIVNYEVLSNETLTFVYVMPSFHDIASRRFSFYLQPHRWHIGKLVAKHLRYVIPMPVPLKTETAKKLHANALILVNIISIKLTEIVYTVKPVLRDHCHERPPVLTDYAFLAQEPTFQYTCNWTCHQRQPVLTDHIFVNNEEVFQDSSTVLKKIARSRNLCCYWTLDSC